MRILYLVTRGDSVGGASIHTRDMAAAMKTAGHTVLIGVGGRGPVTEGYEQVGAPYHSMRYFRREINPALDLLGCIELIVLIRRFHPDLISAHTSKSGFLGRLAGLICGVPVIYTPHCWSFVEGFPKAWLYRWAERVAAPWSTAIVAVAEQERRDGFTADVAGPADIITVHNGMPELPVTEVAGDPSLVPAGLLMVGRFEEQKDQATLLQSLAPLKECAWEVDLAGDGPLREDLELLARRLNIADRVNFLGYRKDVQQLLQSHQVFLLITNWEGFPRSILEAMRAGLPVVATDVGGCSESVVHGETGYLVRRGDIAGLTNILESLIRNSQLRVRMGRAGRERFEKLFTFQTMFSKYQVLYHRLVGPRVVI